MDEKNITNMAETQTIGDHNVTSSTVANTHYNDESTRLCLHCSCTGNVVSCILGIN